MYRRCIFCSSDLGANEVLEEFPVGRTVAFDTARGRLWAVCPRCARWNLAPIEERWEPVESAERIFHDSRLRVQSENVGLAQVADGTRLVRVGEALPGELAAWRYGRQIPRRWMRHIAREAASHVWAAGWGLAFSAGVSTFGLGFGAAALLAAGAVGAGYAKGKRAARPVYHIPAERSPDGRSHLLTRGDLMRVVLLPGEDDRPVEVQVRGSLVLSGDAGRRLLARAMVYVNAGGGSAREVDRAVSLLADAGDAEAYLRRFASGSLRQKEDDGAMRLPIEARFALEMALHEGSERAAMEGELTALRAAWREAEEIARIADALPGEPPPPLPPGS